MKKYKIVIIFSFLLLTTTILKNHLTNLFNNTLGPTYLGIEKFETNTQLFYDRQYYLVNPPALLNNGWVVKTKRHTLMPRHFLATKPITIYIITSSQSDNQSLLNIGFKQLNEKITDNQSTILDTILSKQFSEGEITIPAVSGRSNLAIITHSDYSNNNPVKDLPNNLLERVKTDINQILDLIMNKLTNKQ